MLLVVTTSDRDDLNVFVGPDQRRPTSVEGAVTEP